MVRRLSRDDGFTITEMMVSTAVMLLVIGATLTTFKNAVDVNDAASQTGDTNQNLRAGTNQLLRDLMMAGRVIANGGVPAPNGSGTVAIRRPGPPGTNLTFNFVADEDGSLILPAITTGFGLGPVINGSATDMVTILTVDEFMPPLDGVGVSGTPTGNQAVIANDGSSLTVPATSPWLVGDTVNDTEPINVGDIILFKNVYGMAMQTVTSVDTTHVYFATNDSTNDWFHLNQRSASYYGDVYCLKTPPPLTVPPSTCDASATPPTYPVPLSVVNAPFPATTANSAGGTALLRLLMITYYVDNTTTPGQPRLTRVLNHTTPQALAGVVEDLDLTYDLVDPTNTAVAAVTSLPYTIGGLTYTANMIKKVNIHVGVRSQSISNPTQNYVRNHINTAVNVRSISSVDRYDTNQ